MTNPFPALFEELRWTCIDNSSPAFRMHFNAKNRTIKNDRWMVDDLANGITYVFDDHSKAVKLCKKIASDWNATHLGGKIKVEES